METKRNMRNLGSLVRGAGFSALLLVAACGGAKVQVGSGNDANAKGPKSTSGAAVADIAAKGFNDALQAMVAHDKASDWTDATCTQTAKQFLDAADKQKSETKRDFPEAIYNAGLAYQRCDKDAEAKAQFKAALDLDAKSHRARTQLALYQYKEKGDASLEAVMAELNTAIRDAQFQNVEALVNLAMLQMKRNSTTADQDGANDFDRAKKNLQRALAIDDGYQPAFNQLGLYYLDLAKQRASKGSKTGRGKTATFSKAKRADAQQLELAALVCSQAIRKNPNYPAIHNTAGLIQVELQNINGAVQEFQTAAKLDPNFFEAQMNYAAINLSFRGFKTAEDAYRAALKIHPNDYDAHLGLALALRGQINDSNFDKYVADAQGELDNCKKIAPDRPEAYYNEAILTQEFKAKSGGSDAVPALEAAANTFETFVQKAGSNADYAEAVKRSKDRVQDIRDMVKFIKEGQSQAAIEAARQEKETEQMQQQSGDGGAPSDQPAGGDTGADGGAAP